MRESPTYRGFKHHSAGPQLVMKDDAFLEPGPSRKIWNHSQGFSWGYAGSGPAQLALALLFDVTGDGELSSRLHQDFKWDYVSKWGDDWEITTGEILTWIAHHGGTDVVEP